MLCLGNASATEAAGFTFASDSDHRSLQLRLRASTMHSVHSKAYGPNDTAGLAKHAAGARPPKAGCAQGLTIRRNDPDGRYRETACQNGA
ncbi:hypothetical protein BRDID11004_19400 [Bradyrhizobium diazoefficiens]|uniref:Uncharacterized protein n=1 Tax=Bradyrhizobium diazoefficiens TaxID=1355477 RepID=A0A810A4B5_9BRAD|nr:hypothetical protein F07S3_69790 [Bradyrhizobium diazoefficiens]BCA06203.1 hypothetical protein H12S4_71070 [Bradyrhizobium diazoefficiens]BCA14832.1 hypothetical protein BDHF08_66790 [Bradyrhizobium diazoefficiens]BCA23555.1 hypothetical protein BDHH15_67700 [Bradyrhizobium diazoefficiens]BCE32935.1 hypothetical protein XF2B_67040 [Bradyrhizobium diazoefficiens]